MNGQRLTRGGIDPWVEQNANQALKLAHRGYVLENGQVVLADTAEILLNIAEVKRAYLGIRVLSSEFWLSASPLEYIGDEFSKTFA